MVVLCALSVAMADVVGPEPEDCPAGSVGAANHSGGFCRPAPCGCTEGDACEPVPLCVLQEERPCGGMQDPEVPCTYIHVEAFGPCVRDLDCRTGRCITDDWCEEPAPPDDTRAGCASSPILPSMAFAFASLGLVLLRPRRR